MGGGGGREHHTLSAALAKLPATLLRARRQSARTPAAAAAAAAHRPAQTRTDPQRTAAAARLPASLSGSGRGLHGPAWINSRGFTRTAQREWRDREPRGTRSECVRFSLCRHVFPDLPHAGNRFTRVTLPRVSPHLCRSAASGETFPLKCRRPRAHKAVRKAGFGR